jgi:hypothetical protein
MSDPPSGIIFHTAQEARAENPISTDLVRGKLAAMPSSGAQTEAAAQVLGRGATVAASALKRAVREARPPNPGHAQRPYMRHGGEGGGPNSGCAQRPYMRHGRGGAGPNLGCAQRPYMRHGSSGSGGRCAVGCTGRRDGMTAGGRDRRWAPGSSGIAKAQVRKVTARRLRAEVGLCGNDPIRGAATGAGCASGDRHGRGVAPAARSRLGPRPDVRLR